VLGFFEHVLGFLNMGLCTPALWYAHKIDLLARPEGFEPPTPKLGAGISVAKKARKPRPPSQFQGDHLACMSRAHFLRLAAGGRGGNCLYNSARNRRCFTASTTKPIIRRIHNGMARGAITQAISSHFSGQRPREANKDLGAQIVRSRKCRYRDGSDQEQGEVVLGTLVLPTIGASIIRRDRAGADAGFEWVRGAAPAAHRCRLATRTRLGFAP
jgi:hypothetical protein